jgi:hypothetical protein
MSSAKRAASRSAKKSKPASKDESTKKRGEGQKYKYVELAKASLTNPEPQHFYAVVIDATFPYKTNSERYICSLKIVDPSLHIKNQKGTGDSSDYATLVLYAKRFEDLPIIQRIGDIIRVHRATLRLYNNQRQFNASVFYNSSWALFSTDKKTPQQEVSGDDKPTNENIPFSFSGKHYTFEKQESAILANTRKWANQYVSQYNVITSDMVQPLSKAQSQKNDFDVVAKILQIFELDEYTNELKLKDQSGQVFYTLALKLKFPHLRAGEVVRIRSATYDDTATQKKVLLLSHYSNILTFVSASKLAKEVKSKVSDEKNAEKASLKQPVMMNAVVLTEVDKKHQNLPTTSLDDLFHFSENDPELANKNTFRTTFYVTKIEPADPKEFVKQYDKKTKKTTSLKGSSAGKAAGNLIY